MMTWDDIREAEARQRTFREHGDCDYNGGPGSDQCPHGVYFVGDHRPDVSTDPRGTLSCRVCGGVVRTADGGRFPVHARV